MATKKIYILTLVGMYKGELGGHSQRAFTNKKDATNAFKTWVRENKDYYKNIDGDIEGSVEESLEDWWYSFRNGKDCVDIWLQDVELNNGISTFVF